VFIIIHYFKNPN